MCSGVWPGGFPCHDPESADADLLAFDHRAVRELVLAPGGSADLGLSSSVDLQRARDVVVVHVRLEDVTDAQVPCVGGGQEAPGVTLRIDHDRLAVGDQQIAVVAEARVTKSSYSIARFLARQLTFTGCGTGTL
jgi:hypothetical protein